MASFGTVRPRHWGHRLLSWLFIASIAVYGLTSKPVDIAALSTLHPIVHLVDADETSGSGQSQSKSHVHECSGVACALWIPLLPSHAMAIQRDLKAVLRAPDEDGAGLGPMDLERPPRAVALPIR